MSKLHLNLMASYSKNPGTPLLTISGTHLCKHVSKTEKPYTFLRMNGNDENTTKESTKRL